jgi:hypothetical protein
LKTYHLLLPLFLHNKVRNPNPRDQSKNLVHLENNIRTLVSPSCTRSCTHIKEHAKRTQIIMIITKDRWKANEDIEISCIYEALVYNSILFKIFKTFEHKLKA